MHQVKHTEILAMFAFRFAAVTSYFATHIIIILQCQPLQLTLVPPSLLQLISSLLASPTPSPAQPMSLGKRPCLPQSHWSIPVGVWHQELAALSTSHSTHFKCLMPGATPAMSVCPHHSWIELGTQLIHTPSVCKVHCNFYFPYSYIKWLFALWLT